MSDVPDGTYRAVVDRVEDGLAALELTADDEATDDDGEAADDETTDPDEARERRSQKWKLLVPPENLPVAARQADAVLTVTVADGSLSSASHDPDATDERAETARERFERLSRRPPDGDDDDSLE